MSKRTVALCRLTRELLGRLLLWNPQCLSQGCDIWTHSAGRGRQEPTLGLAGLGSGVRDWALEASLPYALCVLTLVLALHLVESVHCGFYRSPGRGAGESGNAHKSGDRAHCRLPWLLCADVLMVHERTLFDNSHSGSPRAPACFGKASRKRWHFILRDEWEESKGTKGAWGPLGLRPGEARKGSWCRWWKL